MLTFEQKSSVRRHLGFPVVGQPRASAVGGTNGSAFNGYRFFQIYGRLEFKMNNLNPDEESRLFGSPYGGVALVGPPPNPGDAVGFTLTGGGLSSSQTITATAESGDTAIQLIQRLAANATINSAVQSASMVVLAPFGAGPFSENSIPLPELAIVAQSAFTITSPTGSGNLIPQVTANGKLLGPSASLDGTITLWGYIPILDGLEAAFGGASQFLFAQAAGPWKGRSNEIGQRLSLYHNWQVLLSNFLEIPIYTGTPDSQRPQFVGTHRYA